MREIRNWKHNGKDRKQYGKRNTERYDTPFMLLDETLAEKEEKNADTLFYQR